MLLRKKKILPVMLAYVLIAVFSVVSAAAAPTPDKPRILIYGDSLAWGYVPLENPVPPQRFPASERWPGVIQQQLGAEYSVIEEALNSRTAGVDDTLKSLDASIRPYYNLNGRLTLLPIVRSHEPLALVVIELGANDARGYQKQSLEDIKQSIITLIRIVKLGSSKGQNPKILLLAPPALRPGKSEALNSLFAGGYELAARLGPAFKEIARQENVEFFDIGEIIPVADGIDGVHLSAEGNIKLGTALAAKIKSILQ
jgi:lysophospholipase L1-like esterase